jgi:hypothetical protein
VPTAWIGPGQAGPRNQHSPEPSRLEAGFTPRAASGVWRGVWAWVKRYPTKPELSRLMISESHTLVVSAGSLKRCGQRRWPLPRKAERVKAAMSEKFQQCIAPSFHNIPVRSHRRKTFFKRGE